MLHLSIITWHSCYILVYMDPLAYCLTSIWSSFGMFAASALLVVLENPPAHSSLYGPRNAVQDDTSLRHGVAVGHGLKRQPTQPGDNSADFDSSYVLFFWGGLVDGWSQGKSRQKDSFLGLGRCFWKRPTDCAIRISLMCCFIALLGNS